MPEDGRSRLGRGLAALIGDVGEETKVTERARSQRRVPIEYVQPNPRNPRRNFSDVELDELAASIRERGIIQPIVVRPARGTSDHFEIVAGERRWRAAQRAGLHQVPIVSVDVSDGQALELAVIENVQRTDLNPIEEAMGYEQLMAEFDYSQEDVAKIVGKSRAHVANTMRLLKLSEPIKTYVRSGKLTAGHARALLGQPNAIEIAQEIIDRGLNVRQVEAMAREDGLAQARAIRREGKLGRRGAGGLGGSHSGGKDSDTVALEKRISDALGLDVNIDHRGEGGVLRIHYRDLDQLDAVVRKLERD